MTFAMQKELQEASQLELRVLKEAIGNNNQIASFLGVDRSRLSRWGKLEAPSRESQTKIRNLYYVFARLLDVFEQETAAKWLFGINAHLNQQRPIDLIMNGRMAEVLLAIEQEDTGAYA